MTEPRLRIAAIADLHVGRGGDTTWRAVFEAARREADVLVVAGDLTDRGRPEEARRLAEEFRACSIPVVAVLGNHDHESGQVEELGAILRAAGVHLLDGQSCEIAGVAFVGLKGFAGGFGTRMLGSFGETAVKMFVAETVNEALRLENALRRVRPGRTVVVLHYAPVADTVAGEPPEIMPFLGCSRLGETIDRFRVSLILHGHAHHGQFEGRTAGGQRVLNVAAHVAKPDGRPYAVIEV